jgi:hypothetical protein
MRRNAGGKKRDENEPAVVEALRSVGAQVWYLSGAGLPDLLVLFREHFYVLEVKGAKGHLTTAQRDIPWPVVRTPIQALVAICATAGGG